ncbi:MAG TPA: nitronate monooxygenase [Candidatus Sulfotelmatobacter sp.]|nr:nitronate monooxygenase [Candidatus Sulfotelmatobacter sp.]
MERQAWEFLGVEVPIIQAPMAGSDSVALARAVAKAGGLGSLACALLTPEQMRDAAREFRAGWDKPINLNFFCHKMVTPGAGAVERWKSVLRPHYERWGLDIEAVGESRLRLPFDEQACRAVEEIVPEIVSFHFGLPETVLLERLKRRKIKILASATSVREANWLEDHGCDAVIAQGSEAGGHRGMFLEESIASQTGLFALLPQIVDAVRLPVIAAGGIADARGIAATLALGASALLIGTAYLKCPEAKISPLYRQALESVGDGETAITNLFSGRPARGIANRFVRESGPMSSDALAFPFAATYVAPLRAASEKAGSTDYMQMWAGQAAGLGKAMPAEELTRTLWDGAAEIWRRSQDQDEK